MISFLKVNTSPLSNLPEVSQPPVTKARSEPGHWAPEHVLVRTASSVGEALRKGQQVSRKAVKGRIQVTGPVQSDGAQGRKAGQGCLWG